MGQGRFLPDERDGTLKFFSKQAEIPEEIHNAK
jgi:hypothetical protein